MDPKTYEAPTPLLATIPQVPLLPQHIITSGTRKDCVRLRGLPYEAQVENILEFLGEHAKNIVFQGVHMVYNAQVTYYHLNLRFIPVSTFSLSVFRSISGAAIGRGIHPNGR